MSKNALNIDPQKKLEYIELLFELSELTRSNGLLALEDHFIDKEGFIHECLGMIIDGYSSDDFTQIANQRVNAILSYIDAQINLIISGSLAVYSQKSEKIVDLTIKSHSFSNLLALDDGHGACCLLIKNWTTYISKIDDLNLCTSVKLFCLYAQELFVSEVNPGDVILLLNQKKMSVLKELRQVFDVILIGLVSIQHGDNPTITKRKLECFGYKDFLVSSKTKQDIQPLEALTNITSNDSKTPLPIGQKKGGSKNISIEFILQNLCNDSMKKLLDKVDHNNLVEILFHESKSVQNLVYKNLNKNDLKLLKNDLEKRESCGGFKNLEEIQLNFIHLVFQSIEEGKIILGIGN